MSWRDLDAHEGFATNATLILNDIGELIGAEEVDVGDVANYPISEFSLAMLWQSDLNDRQFATLKFAIVGEHGKRGRGVLGDEEEVIFSRHRFLERDCGRRLLHDWRGCDNGDCCGDRSGCRSGSCRYSRTNTSGHGSGNLQRAGEIR